jgi:ParB-like chromosome segregation protein Spo0J
MPEDRRDTRVELILDRLQIPYSYDPQFPIGDVVMPEKGTQVRNSVPDRTTIDEYAVAYQNGAEFPPLVLHHSTKKLIDGNTRYAAATRARIVEHPVYLAEAKTPRIASIVQGALNQLNGERLSNEQAVETARLMHEQGYGAEEIAYSTGRKVSTILDTLRVIEFEKRAEALGVPAQDFSKAQKAQLALIQLDEPMRIVAQAVAAKKVPAEEVRQLAARIQETHSEREAVEVAQEQLGTWQEKALPPKNEVPKEKGAPIRKSAEHLIAKIESLRWIMLSDADYQDTRETLTVLCAAVANIPGR